MRFELHDPNSCLDTKKRKGRVNYTESDFLFVPAKQRAPRFVGHSSMRSPYVIGKEVIIERRRVQSNVSTIDTNSPIGIGFEDGQQNR